MLISVTLKIDGGRLKNQIVVVTPVDNFSWNTPGEVDKDWFDMLLQEAKFFARQVTGPNLRWDEVELDRSIDEDSEEAIDAVSMAALLSALWWVGKNQNIEVTKLTSNGIEFPFRDPDFSVDEYIE